MGKFPSASVQGPTYGFQSIYQGLEQRKDSGGFSAGSEMWDQECFLGGRELNKGRTHLSSGAGGELSAQDCLPGI